MSSFEGPEEKAAIKREQSQTSLSYAEQKQSRPKVKINRSYKLYKNIKDDTGNQEQVVGNS